MVNSACLTPTVAAKSCDNRSDDKSVNRSALAGNIEGVGEVRPLSLGAGLTLGCFGAGGDFEGLRLRTFFLHKKKTSRGPGRPACWRFRTQFGQSDGRRPLPPQPTQTVPASLLEATGAI